MTLSSAFVQPGEVVELTAPYTRSGGQGALVGSIFGIAAADVASGVTGGFHRTGVFYHAKTSAQAWTQGQKIFWDDTNKRFDSDGTVGPAVGVALVAAADPSSSGYVLLTPGTVSVRTASTIAALTFGTDITAATANGTLTDSSAVNPTKAQFDELAKELGTKVNEIVSKLKAVGIVP